MSKRQKYLHRIFNAGIFIKGIDGVLEIIGGTLLFFISPQKINHIIYLLTVHHLPKDPQDRIAAFLIRSVHGFAPSTKFFASLYLVGHGLLNVFLAVSLLRAKFWAYPTALCILGAFISYQIYRFTHTHSLTLLLFTIFDVAVVSLLWQDYRMQKTH